MIEKIKPLAEIVSSHGLTELEYEEGNLKITIKKEIPVAPIIHAQPATPIATVVQAAPVADTAQSTAPQPTPDKEFVDFNNLIEVKSPLVGVFYSAASPDSDMLVSLGSKVKKGDVLCIIETMKVMNEITSEHDGEIVDICVKNGDIAEFGQVLFKMA